MQILTTLKNYDDLIVNVLHILCVFDYAKVQFICLISAFNTI